MKSRPHAVNVSTLSAISGVPVGAITRYLTEGHLTIPGLQVIGGNPTANGRRKGCRYWVPYEQLENARRDVIVLHEQKVVEARRRGASLASRARHARRKANGAAPSLLVAQKGAEAVWAALAADLTWIRRALTTLLERTDISSGTNWHSPLPSFGHPPEGS